MNIIEHEKVTLSDKIYEIEDSKSVLELQKKHGNNGYTGAKIIDALYYQLYPIISITEIKGKKVLDLGCGSKGSFETILCGESYEPWFCRLVKSYGGFTIGIDIGNLEGEEFLGINLNLTNPSRLSCIKNNSIDIINCYRFFSSPTLRQSNIYSHKELRKQIEKEAERILTKKGYFFCTE